MAASDGRSAAAKIGNATPSYRALWRMPARVSPLLALGLLSGCVTPLQITDGSAQVEAIYSVEPNPTRYPDFRRLIRPPAPPTRKSGGEIADEILGAFAEAATEKLLRCLTR